MIDRYLRCAEVLAATGLGERTLYRMMKNGDFPLPKRLGAKAVGWRESVVRNWLDERPDARASDFSLEETVAAHG